MKPIDDERRDRWLDHDRCRLVVRARSTAGRSWPSTPSSFESGLAAEAEQREWLEAELGAARHGDRVVFVSHKPVTGPDDELATAPPYRFLPPPPGRGSATSSAATGVPDGGERPRPPVPGARARRPLPRLGADDVGGAARRHAAHVRRPSGAASCPLELHDDGAGRPRAGGAAPGSRSTR